MSNVASNLFSRDGVADLRKADVPLDAIEEALAERFEDPTYAVSKRVLRRNSQALACRRVRASSYWILTSAP